MSTDIEANINTRLGQTLAALDAVAQRMNRIETATRQANRAQVDYERAAQRSIGARKAAGDGAKALSQIGGPSGGIFGKIGAGIGLGGVFGPLAIGAAAAGVGFRLLSNILTEGVTRAEALVRAEQRLTDARKAGEKNAAAVAISGLSQLDAVRTLRARGGQDAVDAADSVAAGGFTSPADAQKGVASIYGSRRTRARAGQAIRVATLAAQTGEVGFSEAAQFIADHPGLATSATAEASYAQAARTVRGATSRRYTTEQVRAAEIESINDPYLREGQKATGVAAGIPQAGRRAVAAGAALDDATARLRDAQDPVGAALRAAAEVAGRELAVQEATLKAQYRIVTLLEGLTGRDPFGAGRRAESEAARLNQSALQTGAGAFAPGG